MPRIIRRLRAPMVACPPPAVPTFSSRLDTSQCQYTPTGFRNSRPKMQKATRRWLLALYGSPTRARTWDLRINSPSLYQLSYQGIAAPGTGTVENLEKHRKELAFFESLVF